MPSSISRNIHRIYRCYLIVHSFIRDCEIVFVSLCRLVLIVYYLMLKLLLSFWKGYLKTVQEWRDNPGEKSEISKIAKERDFLVTLTLTVFDCFYSSLPPSKLIKSYVDTQPVLVSCMVPTGLIELWWSYSQLIVNATENQKSYSHIETLFWISCYTIIE